MNRKQHKYTLESITQRAHEILAFEGPYSQGDIKIIREVILSFAMSEVDFTLIEALCEKFIKSKDEDLKRISIICVGHVARVYQREVNSNITAEIYNIYEDKTHQCWGEADTALDDIEIFLKIPK